MMKKVLFMFLIAGCTQVDAPKKEKDYYAKINDLVLSEHQPGLEYFYKTMLPKGVLEYRLKYLGSIKTNKGDSLQFSTCIIYTGNYEDAKRASAVVNLYDAASEYLGSYQVGPVWALPSGIENGNLVFAYNDEHCNQKTLINFTDSIPRQIFIKCTEKGGDIYTFSTEQ